MKRRTFLRNISMAAGGQVLLNGASIQLLHSEPMLKKYAQLSINDKVLVIVQLHGGNDGLNTVIPASQYDKYYNFRPNLAISQTGPRKFIPLDNSLPDGRLVGLHPDMVGLKAMYDQGKMTILQNVGYENMNGSHFKSRDIWFGGVGYNDRISSGWIGRYLQDVYEQNEPGKIFPDDFPENSNMKDPLGLEFSGGDISLGFHTEKTIPTAISIPDPDGFFSLVRNQDGYNEERKFEVDERGIPPIQQYDPAKNPSMNTLYGEELNWILKIEKGTDKYAERLKSVYHSASNSTINYPTSYPLGTSGDFDSGLGNSLRVIAQLLAGGCQTKVFLVRLGGFDTHINQVEHYDNSIGHHASLLYNISTSMKAFYDDLKVRNLDDKVLSVTMSEFGRRALSNNSYGCDHGTMAPMFVFGTKINPGVIGKNPDMSRVNNFGGNIPDNKEDIIDHRVVFSTILQKWFEVDKAKVLSKIFPTLKSTSTGGTSDPNVNFGWGDQDIEDLLPLFGDRVTALDEFITRRFRLYNVAPNPVSQYASFGFYMDNPAFVQFGLYDMRGNLVVNILNEHRQFGEHLLPPIDLSNIKPGMYIYKIEAGVLKGAKKLIKL